MVNFIRKYLSWIVLFVVVLAFFAPMILTHPGLECFNKTTTGQIGDTIGGTTAPFWGFLSVILLYLTFKEQQTFNKNQQVSNDYVVLMNLRSSISEISNNTDIRIHPYSDNRYVVFKGFLYISEIRKTLYENSLVDYEDFKYLYTKAKETAELCLMFYEILNQSSLSNEQKRILFHSISVHSEYVCQFFDICVKEDIHISTMDNVLDSYKPMSEKYLNQFKDVYKNLKETGIRS